MFWVLVFLTIDSCYICYRVAKYIQQKLLKHSFVSAFLVHNNHWQRALVFGDWWSVFGKPGRTVVMVV